MVLYFRCIDLEHNRRRHYLLMLQRDLLGRLVLVRRWGRIGAPGWQGSQTRLVNDDREAGRIIRDTLNRRRRHGYRVVESERPDLPQ